MKKSPEDFSVGAFKDKNVSGRVGFFIKDGLLRVGGDIARRVDSPD